MLSRKEKEEVINLFLSESRLPEGKSNLLLDPPELDMDLNLAVEVEAEGSTLAEAAALLPKAVRNWLGKLALSDLEQSDDFFNDTQEGKEEEHGLNEAVGLLNFNATASANVEEAGAAPTAAEEEESTTLHYPSIKEMLNFQQSISPPPPISAASVITQIDNPAFSPEIPLNTEAAEEIIIEEDKEENDGENQNQNHISEKTTSSVTLVTQDDFSASVAAVKDLIEEEALLLPEMGFLNIPTTLSQEVHFSTIIPAKNGDTPDFIEKLESLSVARGRQEEQESIQPSLPQSQSKSSLSLIEHPFEQDDEFYISQTPSPPAKLPVEIALPEKEEVKNEIMVPTPSHSPKRLFLSSSPSRLNNNANNTNANTTTVNSSNPISPTEEKEVPPIPPLNGYNSETETSKRLFSSPTRSYAAPASPSANALPNSGKSVPASSYPQPISTTPLFPSQSPIIVGFGSPRAAARPFASGFTTTPQNNFVSDIWNPFPYSGGGGGGGLGGTTMLNQPDFPTMPIPANQSTFGVRPPSNPLYQPQGFYSGHAQQHPFHTNLAQTSGFLPSRPPGFLDSTPQNLFPQDLFPPQGPVLSESNFPPLSKPQENPYQRQRTHSDTSAAFIFDDETSLAPLQASMDDPLLVLEKVEVPNSQVPLSPTSYAIADAEAPSGDEPAFNLKKKEEEEETTVRAKLPIKKRKEKILFLDKEKTRREEREVAALLEFERAKEKRRLEEERIKIERARAARLKEEEIAKKKAAKAKADEDEMHAKEKAERSAIAKERNERVQKAKDRENEERKIKVAAEKKRKEEEEQARAATEQRFWDERTKAQLAEEERKERNRRLKSAEKNISLTVKCEFGTELKYSLNSETFTMDRVIAYVSEQHYPGKPLSSLKLLVKGKKIDNLAHATCESLHLQDGAIIQVVPSKVSAKDVPQAEPAQLSSQDHPDEVSTDAVVPIPSSATIVD